MNSRTAKGVEYLVEASAAEAEAISAALAAAKARQENGEVELPDRDRGAEATPSGKHTSSLIKPDSVGSNNNVSGGVRLHHRAVSDTCYLSRKKYALYKFLYNIKRKKLLCSIFYR